MLRRWSITAIVILGMLAANVGSTGFVHTWSTSANGSAEVQVGTWLVCPVEVDVRITPRVLNVGSANEGNSVTAHFDGGLPAGITPANLHTIQMRVKLADGSYFGQPINAQPHPANEQAGIVKFKSSDVVAMLDGMTGSVTLELSGSANGCSFVGTDTIKVINPGGGPGSKSSSEETAEALPSDGPGELVDGAVDPVDGGANDENGDTPPGDQNQDEGLDEDEHPESGDSIDDPVTEDPQELDAGGAAEDEDAADPPADYAQQPGGDKKEPPSGKAEGPDNAPGQETPPALTPTPTPVTPTPTPTPTPTDQEPSGENGQVYPPLQPIEKPGDRPGQVTPTPTPTVEVETPTPQPTVPAPPVVPTPSPTPEPEPEEVLMCPVDAVVRIQADELDVGLDGDPLAVTVQLPFDLPREYNLRNVRSVTLRVKLGEDRYGAREIEGGRNLTSAVPGAFRFTHEQMVFLLDDYRGAVELEVRGDIGDCAFAGTDTLRVIESEPEPAVEEDVSQESEDSAEPLEPAPVETSTPDPVIDLGETDSGAPVAVQPSPEDPDEMREPEPHDGLEGDDQPAEEPESAGDP